MKSVSGSSYHSPRLTVPFSSLCIGLSLRKQLKGELGEPRVISALVKAARLTK
jgi:hypothetical protein